MPRSSEIKVSTQVQERARRVFVVETVFSPGERQADAGLIARAYEVDVLKNWRVLRNILRYAWGCSPCRLILDGDS